MPRRSCRLVGGGGGVVQVDFREFMVFNAEWPAMFFPAYRLQEKMIERSLGRYAASCQPAPNQPHVQHRPSSP